ncbi:MAG: ArnT family glycosyltransferase [Planctomycetota bacterium]
MNPAPREPAEPRREMRMFGWTPSRWTVALAVLGCCLLTLWIKHQVNVVRVNANHGDSSFYFAVARNVAEGRGFLIDYVWNFWNHPEGIPTPANVWWMPLASIIGAIGMWLGQHDYPSAQAATIAFSSLLPLVLYLLGRDMFGSRPIGLLGALLGTAFHLFLDQPSGVLSHSPYVVLASLSLWLIVRAAEHDRWLPWCGAAIALTQLARSDAVMLFGALAVALLARRAPGRWPRPRALVGLVLGYALVMSPWWAYNLHLHGVLMPGGAFKAIFLPHYEAWYSLPESVTPQRWLDTGWNAIWKLKGTISAANLDTAATGLITGAPERDKAWADPSLVTLWALSLVGLATMLRRQFLPFWALLLLQYTFYSLIFTAVGMESFRTGMYSLYPTLVLASAAGLLLLARGATRLAQSFSASVKAQRVAGRVVALAAVVLVGWLLLGQYRFARASLERKADGIAALNAVYRTMRVQTFDALGLSDAVIMARDVHQLNALAGMKGVMIPLEPEPVIREVARRYGARHLLLTGWGDQPLEKLSQRPALADIGKNPHFRRIFGPAKMRGIRWELYEILE